MLSFKDITHLMRNKKARDEQGLFVAEGKKLFLEAPRGSLVQVLMTREFAWAHPDLLEQIPGDVPFLDGIDESRFASLSDTRSPQGILTVMRKQTWKDPIRDGSASDEEAPLYCILENLQDPGNAGTILRTGEAAGVSAVYLTEGSVDLYSPKVIRSTMGSIFRVPHIVVPSAKETVRGMKGLSVSVYAAHLKGNVPYTDCDLKGGSAFVIGNESRGITDELARECSGLIRIPMLGHVESLNAAMAAGILFYEAARQRRNRED